MSDKMYDTAYIYKISGGGLTYYGSTKDAKKREISHRTKYKSFTNGKKECYISSAEVYATGQAVFEIIEIHNNITKTELENIERNYIKNFDCVNKVKYIMGDNKGEYLKKYNKQYSIDKKKEISENKKKYYKENYDKINLYRNTVYKCDICGTVLKKANQHEHVKSQKHKKALQNTTPITITMTNSNNNTIIF
jgi:hypothetical protein